MQDDEAKIAIKYCFRKIEIKALNNISIQIVKICIKF